jgi:glutamate racemase
LNAAQNPIGVFDSGIGGLSVLRALRARMPAEDFVYLADSAYAPYGERDDAYVIERSRSVAQQLVAQHRIKALVVACNTATAAAAQVLRSEFAQLPLIGVEPAIKPAAASSRTRRIAVLATRGTVGSAKFARLLDSLKDQAEFIVQPCDGLAEAIELEVQTGDATKVIAACAQYTRASGLFYSQSSTTNTPTHHSAIDTVVLGCTHYVFALDHLRRSMGDAAQGVQFIETGEPVARHTQHLLQTAGLLKAASATCGRITLQASGNARALQIAAQRWLGE